jgi:hypothetical protein
MAAGLRVIRSRRVVSVVGLASGFQPFLQDSQGLWALPDELLRFGRASGILGFSILLRASGVTVSRGLFGPSSALRCHRSAQRTLQERCGGCFGHPVSCEALGPRSGPYEWRSGLWLRLVDRAHPGPLAADALICASA